MNELENKNLIVCSDLSIFNKFLRKHHYTVITEI